MGATQRRYGTRSGRRGAITSRRSFLRASAIGGAGAATLFALACSGSNNTNNGTPSKSTAAATSGRSASGSPPTPAGRSTPLPTAVQVANVPPPPQWSKTKYPDLNKLLVDYNWRNLPYRLKRQQPQTGGVFVSVQANADPFDWVRNSQGQSTAALVSNNVLSLAAGAFANNDDLQVATTDSLAQSYQQIDNLTYVFKFYPNIKWHNKPPVNGRDFTADDVKYAWEMLASKDSIHRDIYGVIDKAEVQDPLTIKATLKQPFAPLLLLIATANTSLFPRELFEKPDGMRTDAIGTGPFMLKSDDPTKETVYVRNPTYHIKDGNSQQLPYLDGVHHLAIADPETQKSAFIGKQMDYVRILTNAEWQEVRKNVPDATGEIFCQSSPIGQIINFQYKNQTFQDPRARQAISLGIDRVGTVQDTFYKGSLTPLHYIGYNFFQPWPTPWEQLGPYQVYDPQKAKQLLAAAGYASGLKTECMTTSAAAYAFLTGVQDDLKQIGVQMDLKTVDATAWSSAFLQRTFPALHPWTLITSNPTEVDSWSYGFFHTKGPLNGGSFSDPQSDQLAEAQRLELDHAKRLDILKQQEKRLQEVVAQVFLGGAWENRLFQPWVHDISDSVVMWANSWIAHQLARAWFDNRAPKRDVNGLVEAVKGRRYL